MVSSTRFAVLAALALMLSNPAHAAEGEVGTSQPAAAGWPTANAISNVVVTPHPDGLNWVVEFDYAFVGKPAALLSFELTLQPGSVDPADWHGIELRDPPSPGRHHVSTVLALPSKGGTSTRVTVSIVGSAPDHPMLASESIDKVIRWPSEDERELGNAVRSINNGSRLGLERARQILERLIARNPKNAPAYVELARYTMKTNWGPEGLHQGETLLDSALKIDPDSANAKILLGYVYAHQRRFGEAEVLFVDAARSHPDNVWLWTNWGELFEMQGKTDKAIAKYREALAHPATWIYDSAHKNAYTFLLKLLAQRDDVDGVEALYKQRIAEFGPSSCYSADYAQFKLYVRGDAPGAIAVARGALKLDCDDAPSRRILGLASYLQWARDTGTAGSEALNQARIFLPMGPKTLYLLADNDRTLVAVKKLVAGGEAIDQKDNENMTALGHALGENRPETAVRLLRAGAHADTPVGFEDLPAALLPVMSRDLDTIRALKRAGVDYSKLRYHGSTALEYAEQTGDHELLDVLKHKERAL